MSNYRDGAMTKIPGSPGQYWFTMPLGNGKRSPRFRCRSRPEGRRLCTKWELDQEQLVAQQAIEDANRLQQQYTVRHYLGSHYDAIKDNLAETTRVLHRSTLNVHILKDDDFCNLDFRLITANDVQSFLGRIKGSDNTKSRCYKLLHSFFQAAFEEGVLEKNPIFIAKGKKPKRGKSEVVSFSPEDERKLLQYVANDPFWKPVVVFTLDTGCRVSEVTGLKWDCVDLDRGEVHIRRTLHTVPGQGTVLTDTTKTDASRRTIPVSNLTLNVLSGLLEQSTGQSRFVFGDAGQPMSKDTFQKRWDRMLVKAGIPHYGFHSLRHTCSTRLLRSGCYLTAVSARLGHSKPSTTLNLYSHALPSDQHPLVASFDNMFRDLFQ